MKGYHDKRYNIALDNLYTSPEPLKGLFRNWTDAYDTLRKKEGLPEIFWNWKQQIRFCDKIYMVLRWNVAYKTKKQKIVSMISIKHTGWIINSGKSRKT